MGKMFWTILAFAVITAAFTSCSSSGQEYLNADQGETTSDESQVTGQETEDEAYQSWVLEEDSQGSGSTEAVMEIEATAEDINVWGDSMANGTYFGGEVSYPAVLEELTGIHTNNFGINGDKSWEIMARSLVYGDQSEDIMIIQMGDNGGWDNIEDLIAQHKEMIKEGGTDKYIVVSSTDDPNDYDQIWAYTDEAIGLEDTWYEEELREAFGEHLFIGRKYLIEKGLEVTGLEETEEDRARAEQGLISLQFREEENDNTHLNADGYTAMAYGIYELGQELDYWP